MSQFIATSMPRGYAGQVTRGFYTNVIEAKDNDTSAPVVDFGTPVKISDSKESVTPCTAESDVVYGFAVRVYGQANVVPGASGQQSLKETAVISVLRKGYVAVKVEGGEPKFGDKVYLTASGAITATAGATPVANAIFMGATDADGIAEISFNI